jgi:hypothetical protein
MILSFNMIMGRFEIIAILYIFISKLRRWNNTWFYMFLFFYLLSKLTTLIWFYYIVQNGISIISNTKDSFIELVCLE